MHSPMKLDALFSGIVEFGILKETIEIYPNVNDVDKKTIEEGIIKYMVTFNTGLGEIEDQFPNDLKSVLNARRQEAIANDAKMKKFSLENIGSSLTHDERLKLSHFYGKYLGQKRDQVLL
jgi:hypothetical protein